MTYSDEAMREAIAKLEESIALLTELYEAIDENEPIYDRLENRLAVLNIAVADLYELANEASQELL